MAVTIESKYLERIEATCNIQPSDTMLITDFSTKSCFVSVKESEHKAGIELTKEDAEKVIDALRMWINAYSY